MKNINVRIPDDLHERVKQAADSDRRSMNAEILWLIEQGLERAEEKRGNAGHDSLLRAQFPFRPNR